MDIKWLYYPNLVLTPFVVVVLLSTRVHYSIDIMAAVIFTLWLRGHVLSYVALYDRFWSALLVWLVSVISRIINYLV